MPIKSHRTAQKRKPKTSKSFWRYLLGFFGLITLVFIAYLILVPAKYWDGKSRLALAIQDKSGAVKLSVFDPQTESITVITVPANTQVDVARQLGEWKIGSVWKLGENEKIGGSIISETVTKTLRLPTEGWADMGALGFTKDNNLAIWQSVIGAYKTNLSLKDRIGIAFFAQSVKSPQRNEIDLSQTPLLIRTKLSDGSLGYEVRDLSVAQISAYFADARISEENIGVSIFYPRSRMQEVQKLGEIIQILGVKVTSLELLTQDLVFNCKIVSQGNLTAKKIAEVFNCKTEIKNNQTGIQLLVGEEFFRRF